MNKLVTATGYCPTQAANYSISIIYVDTSTLSYTCYDKGTYHCDYNEYGNKCKSGCPIYKSPLQKIK